MKLQIAIAGLVCFATFAMSESSPRAQQQETIRSVWEGVFTKDQAKRGEALYAQHCSSCHAGDLTGVDEAPALAGPAFLGNWDGLTIGDLSERVRISMPPNSPGKLSRQQISDLLSHVLVVNSFPAGTVELEAKLESLKQIRIEATKPSR